jgi:hypothetical protein
MSNSVKRYMPNVMAMANNNGTGMMTARQHVWMVILHENNNGDGDTETDGDHKENTVGQLEGYQRMLTDVLGTDKGHESHINMSMHHSKHQWRMSAMVGGNSKGQQQVTAIAMADSNGSW